MTEAMLNGKSAAPNSAELISRAKALIPLLRANANLADQLGRRSAAATAPTPRRRRPR
jgi:hypothetical protein